MNNETTKPSETMVERVAAAIHNSIDDQSWDQCPDGLQKTKMRDSARAALSCLPDPIGVIDRLCEALTGGISDEWRLDELLATVEQFKKEWCNDK